MWTSAIAGPAAATAVIARAGQRAATYGRPRLHPALRDGSRRRLARLAAEHRPDGRALVPAADPATWWGTRDLTMPSSRCARPTSPSSSPPAPWPAWSSARRSGSSSARPAGRAKSSQAQGFGNLVHAIADRVAKGELASDPGAVDELMVLVDDVWDQLGFRTPWSRARARRGRKALTRFVTWHGRPDARTVLATEQDMRAEVTLPDGQRVVLTGYADRLEIDDAGRVVVVDLKTGKYPPGRSRRTPSSASTSTPSTTVPSTTSSRGRRPRVAPSSGSCARRPGAS